VPAYTLYVLGNLPTFNNGVYSIMMVMMLQKHRDMFSISLPCILLVGFLPFQVQQQQSGTIFASNGVVQALGTGKSISGADNRQCAAGDNSCVITIPNDEEP
jgi:hypothetical protein